MRFPEIPIDASRNDRQKALNDVLGNLSKEQISSREEADSAARFFVNLYSDSTFRHRYSEIEAVAISGFEGDRSTESVVCLSDNLSQLARYSEGEGGEEPSSAARKLASMPQFFKLRDHVDLEAMRLGRDANMIGVFGQSIGEVKSDVSEMSGRLEEASRNAERAGAAATSAGRNAKRASRKISNAQRETIAILGVFSAIVIAFNAGVAFTTSAIQPLSASGAFSIAFIVCIVGLFLFNAMFALMTFVYRIVRRANDVWCLVSCKAYAVINAVILALVVLFGVATVIPIETWVADAITSTEASGDVTDIPSEEQQTEGPADSAEAQPTE